MVMTRVYLSQPDGFARGIFKYKIGDVVEFDADKGKIIDGIWDDGGEESYVVSYTIELGEGMTTQVPERHITALISRHQ
jgi:hypothetical protein